MSATLLIDRLHQVPGAASVLGFVQEDDDWDGEMRRAHENARLSGDRNLATRVRNFSELARVVADDLGADFIEVVSLFTETELFTWLPPLKPR